MQHRSKSCAWSYTFLVKFKIHYKVLAVEYRNLGQTRWYGDRAFWNIITFFAWQLVFLIEPIPDASLYVSGKGESWEVLCFQWPLFDISWDEIFGSFVTRTGWVLKTLTLCSWWIAADFWKPTGDLNYRKRGSASYIVREVREVRERERERKTEVTSPLSR